MTTSLRFAHGRAALLEVADAYDALSARTRAPVTSRRTWLQTWADCYPDWAPWLVLAERGGVLVGCAPLATRTRPGGVLHVVGMGNGPTDDLRLPAVDAAAAAALADGVAEGLDAARRWLLRLEQVPHPDEAVDALLRRLPLSRVEPGEGMPTVRITDRDPATYLSKNTRKALAKVRNKLAAAGLEPELRWTRDAAEVRAVLPELQRVHRARDEHLGRRSDHADPRAARFHAEVVLRHAERGEVELLTLRLRGELAAYVCAFADGGALRSWDNRLAPAFADLSAGRLANTEALRHAVTAGYDELDWMQGEEPYKLQSATEVVPRCNLVAWSSAGVRRAHELVERTRTAKRDSERLTRLWWAISDVRRRVSRRTGEPAGS